MPQEVSSFQYNSLQLICSLQFNLSSRCTRKLLHQNLSRFNISNMTRKYLEEMKNHPDRTSSLVPTEFLIKLSHQHSYNSNWHNSKIHLNRSVWWVTSAIFDHVIRISAKKCSIASFFRNNLFIYPKWNSSH